MKEEWKQIKDYEGYYEVSNKGSVRSLDRLIQCSNGQVMKFKGQYLSKTLKDDKYYVVKLRKNKKAWTIHIHQLVAQAFLDYEIKGNRKIVVDHINNIKTDNRLENLQVTTQRINASKDKLNKTSKFTGVVKVENKWSSNIKIEGKTINLGLFESEENAFKSYNHAVGLVNKGITHPSLLKEFYHRNTGVKTYGFTGVSFNKRVNKWRVQLVINKKSIYTKHFDSELDASTDYFKQKYIRVVKPQLNQINSDIRWIPNQKHILIVKP